MKKLLLTGALFTLGFTAGLRAQLYQAATMTATIHDTLHYYMNKYYFKTGNTTYSNYPIYAADASALTTYTNISYMASRFEVPAGESVVVDGAEVFCAKAMTTANLKVPVRLYLLSLDANGVPKLPAIDSEVVNVGSTSMIAAGVTFSHVTAAARTMTSNFAIAARNISGASGDFVYFNITHGVTQANGTGQYRYGEGNSFVYYNHGWNSTTDFTMVPTNFGPTTDYEFMVAPHVTYTVQISQKLPDSPNKVLLSTDTSVPDTFCTRTDLTFQNTSSKIFEHRMYNLNAFHNKWNLYGAFPNPGTAFTDSAITWYFEMLDFGNWEPRRFLPYVSGNEQIKVASGLTYYPACFTANEFRVRQKHMGAFGMGTTSAFNQNMIICMRWCNGDTLGLMKVNNYDNLKVYPNPTENGKTFITGMKEKNTITVYNMLGEAILTETTENEKIELNLGKLAKGTYMVRVTNSANETRVVRLVNP